MRIDWIKAFVWYGSALASLAFWVVLFWFLTI